MFASRAETVTGVLATSLGMFLAAAPVSAHHSFSATYDSERRVTLQGVVTRIDWVNPHAYLFVNDTDANGTVTNWALEFGNPFDLERDGWTEDSLQVGDMVRIEGVPARGQSKRAFARSVVRLATGERLFMASGDGQATSSRGEPAPRWADGQVRFGPPPGEAGFWGRASAVGLVESTGVEIAMNDDAILLNIADADRVAPFRPWAKALYEYRQRNLLRDDPLTRCLPPGGTRHFHSAYGLQFVEQRELDRILVLLGGDNRNWRVIHMDGRPVGQEELAVRTYYGASSGRWEGDTLVVETLGFNERFWFTSGGLPHTEALHLTERISRPDSNTLRYEVTVDDPRAYTRPWTGGWTIQWVPGEDIREYFCEENAESTFIR